MAKLNVNSIKKDNNKFNEKKTITFENGNTLNIDKYFSNEKIKELMNTIVQVNEKAKEYKMTEEINKYNFLDFVSLIMIEVFTELDFSKNVKTKIREYSQVFESDYYMPIIKGFEQKEVQKVFILMTEQMTIAQSLQSQMMDVKAQVNNINNNKQALFPEAYPKGTNENEQKTTN
jgi:hypothetical protein